MKKLLVLGGGSQKNKEWVDNCAVAYRDLFDTVDCIYYSHWETGEKNVDSEIELKKIKTLVETDTEAQWYVCAKSIGTILTVQAIEQAITVPVKCIFFGMPLNLVKDSVFAGDLSVLKQLTMPTLVFHNDNDPTAEYELTKDMLNEFVPLCEFETLSGDNHSYVDFSDYRPTIISFLNS